MLLAFAGKTVVQSRGSRTTFAANVVLQATLRSERVRSALLLPVATIPNPKLPWGVKLRIRGLPERDEEGSAIAEPSFLAQCSVQSQPGNTSQTFRAPDHKPWCNAQAHELSEGEKVHCAKSQTYRREPITD